LTLIQIRVSIYSKISLCRCFSVFVHASMHKFSIAMNWLFLCIFVSRENFFVLDMIRKLVLDWDLNMNMFMFCLWNFGWVVLHLNICFMGILFFSLLCYLLEFLCIFAKCFFDIWKQNKAKFYLIIVQKMNMNSLEMLNR
jgi:hypothetical protein